MKKLELSAEEKRKSLVITILIYGFFLLILFFVRFWPPTNQKELAQLATGGGGGVMINFGNSDYGSGNDFQSEKLDVKTTTNATPQTQNEFEENIVSSDNPTDNTAIITKKTHPLKTEKPKVKIDPKPVTETKPKVSKTTNDALSNILGGTKKGGDGNDSQSGNKGKSNGSIGSSDYYGNGGSGGGNGSGNGTGNGSGSGAGNGSGTGGGTGYSLGNRKALSKPQPEYNCNEQGKVVVEVVVDKTGKTLNAVAGVRGTTNTAPCLLSQAKLAAMNTKWQASPDAPEKQVGKIIYSFSLN